MDKRLWFSCVLLAVLGVAQAQTAPLLFTCPVAVAEGAAGFSACTGGGIFQSAADTAKALSGPSSTPTWRTYGPLPGATTVRTCPAASVSADQKTCTVSAQWVPKSTLITTPPPAAGTTAPVTVRWLAPTQNTDGSALTNLAGFNLYEGMASPPANKVGTTAENVLTYRLEGLAPGRHYFAVTAFNTQSIESALSAIVSRDVVAISPPTVALSCAPIDGVEQVTATCTWSSSNATGCAASWAGTKALNGTETLPPLTASATLTLTCTGAGGSATASATVSVSPRPKPPGAPVIE